MLTKRPARCTALGVCALVLACGGHRGAGPTPVDPPTIACPAAPDPVESLDGSAQAVSFAAPTVTGGQAPLNTSCLPISGSTFPVGTTTVTCTTNDAQARAASCTFPVVVQPPPKLAVTSFLAFGDSLTWGEDGRAAASSAGQHVFIQLPQGQRYPDILQQELQARYRQQQVSVTNAGCPGETLSDPGRFDDKVGCFGIRADDPSAFRRLTSLVSLHRWDSILLMEGSNDVNLASGDSKVLPIAIGYFRQMVDAAKGSGVRVIVATVPPMVPPGAFERAKGYAVVPTYDNMVRGIATSESAPLADVYQAFGSDAPTLIGFDGLHPNPDGYKRIADTFFAAIKSSIEMQPSSVAGSTRVKR